MKAAILVGPHHLTVQSAAEPRVDADEIVVRVGLAGLCGTDVSIFTGGRPVAYPRVMGHEFLGRVETVAPGVTRVRTGDRVVIEPNYSCGVCPLCREGNRNLCAQRTAVGIDVDGGFAELVRVPARCAWPVPAGVSDDDALLTEPLAVVVRAVERGAPRAGQTAAVVGAGTLGLLALQTLRARGVRVLVVGRSARRLPLARELGADAVHALADGPPESAARTFSGREGVDLVVETAGTPEAVDQALVLVRPGGRVVLTGLPHAPTAVSFFSVVRREITITGSMIYQDEFPKALALVERGAVRGGRLITHRFPLDRIHEAFVAHRDAAAIKVAVVPDRG
ncbi:MAG: alcohol dehydrogenase catalytic domain-containing protein [Candidatus Rokubacteria bacterium]|nr:alcohol dehydrogenase catalytic domain-containing protein [Candidatus Rokubacteria bacterium]